MDGRLNLEGQGSLYIGRLEGSDSGLYTCRATNMEDSLDADAMLRVLGEYIMAAIVIKTSKLVQSDNRLFCPSGHFFGVFKIRNHSEVSYLVCQLWAVSPARRSTISLNTERQIWL